MGFFASSGILNRKGFFSAIPAIAAQPTLPLSTTTLTIVDLDPIPAHFFSYFGDWRYDSGYSGYVWILTKDGTTYGLQSEWCLIYFDGDNYNLYSSNPASILSIPLTGWDPSITITTP
jgi:hypothetical protein